jgi:carbonic anhydrase
MSIADLIQGNQAFRTRAADNPIYRELAKGQHPGILWIGCSDSRVTPEEITNAGPGKLFVMRNVANTVPPFGTANDAVGAVIEYAIEHLHVGDVIVCGHTGCGGIAALAGHADLRREPHLARWLEWARAAHANTNAALAEEERLVAATKANVVCQLRNLATYPNVANAVRAGTLKTHAWLYVLDNGELQGYDDASGQWRAVESLGHADEGGSRNG